MIGALEYTGHRTIAAGAFPYFAVECFIVEKGKGCPRGCWKEVRPLKVGITLDGGFKATV
ncbi:MAG: hypothetical protein BGN84_04625 [Afipia sp. 62-7]|nr:MAG: hypothetical protein BGN84_04625 [Afipia sp. 62-7]